MTKHIIKYVPIGGHSDSFECSCGWKSQGYWDLESAAWDEWLLHAHDTATPVEAKDQARQAELIRERDHRRGSLQRQRESIDRQIAALEPAGQATQAIENLERDVKAGRPINSKDFAKALGATIICKSCTPYMRARALGQSTKTHQTCANAECGCVCRDGSRGN